MHVGVVGAQPPASEAGDVDPVEGDPAAGHPGQPQDHPADGALAAAALPDEGDHLASADLQVDVVDRDQLAAAEGADPVGLGDALEPQHGQDAFQQATKWSGATSTNGGWVGALVEGQRAAVPEPAALGRVEQGWRAAGDALEPAGAVADPDLGQGGQQQLGVGMPGGGDQGVGRGPLGQATGVHHDDAVGDLVHQRQVVGDDDGALDVVAVAEVDQCLGHRLLGGDVEGRGDLVGDQQRGVQQGRDDHDHALLHPARELDRVAVQHLRVEPDQLQAAQQLVADPGQPHAPRLQQLGHQRADPPGRVHGAHGVLGDDRDLLEPEAVHGHVVPDGELLAVQLDAAADVAHAAVQADQALAEGRLAAAGLAGQPDQLAVGHPEADPVRAWTSPRRVRYQTLRLSTRRLTAVHISRSLGLKTSSRPTFMM